MSDLVVRFSSTDEFLEELERDVPVTPMGYGIDRGIVRVACRWTRRMGTARPPHVYDEVRLVASYSTAGQLVLLEEPCGTVGAGESRELVSERAQAAADAVRQACERLGLETRGGVLEHRVPA